MAKKKQISYVAVLKDGSFHNFKSVTVGITHVSVGVSTGLETPPGYHENGPKGTHSVFGRHRSYAGASKQHRAPGYRWWFDTGRTVNPYVAEVHTADCRDAALAALAEEADFNGADVTGLTDHDGGPVDTDQSYIDGSRVDQLVTEAVSNHCICGH